MFFAEGRFIERAGGGDGLKPILNPEKFSYGGITNWPKENKEGEKTGETKNRRFVFFVLIFLQKRLSVHKL